MKLLIKSIFVVFLIVVGFISAVSAIPVISIGEYGAESGKSITGSIMISDSNLSSGNISIAYDPLVVHVTDVSSGSGKALTVITEANNIDNKTGIVKFIFLNVQPPLGNVTLANVVFKSVGRSKSSTSLNIIDHTMYTSDCPVECKVENGTFTVLSGSSGSSDSSDSSSSGTGGASISVKSYENIAVNETPSSSSGAGGEGIEDTTPEKDINKQLSQDAETTNMDEDGIPGPGLLIGLLSIWIVVQVLQKKILH